MFIDKVTLTVRGGKGGKGARSYYRTRSNPRGGPDGGDGGDGGSVLIKVDHNIYGLNHLKGVSLIRAEDGGSGGSNNCKGRKGNDHEILVPEGTKIVDMHTNIVLKDMKTNGDKLVIALGGAGGRGNKFFKSSVRQLPKFSNDGKKGEERTILLKVQMIANIGLVGFPNAGKTTLINALTSSKYKAADYKFTTLGPQPAVLKAGEYEKPLVIMDIPGLIEGASEGKGKGIEFLSQIERTESLIMVIDMGPKAEVQPLEAVRILKEELERYSESLPSKVKIIAFNKIDLNKKLINKKLVHKIIPDCEIVYISAELGTNLGRLQSLLLKVQKAL